MKYFPTNSSGVEDSMDNSHSYLISFWAGIVFESYEILLFRYVSGISNSPMIFMLKYAFTCIFHSAYTSLDCRKGYSIASQTNCSHRPFIGAVHVTVNSEIFARILFSRNFAYVKFRENKTLVKWRNHSVVY